MVNDINSGDTALVLISSGLVLLMTPGLAFFYGGLVRAKNVVHTMILSLVCMAVVGVVWMLVGYSLAFSPGGALNPALGGLSFLGLVNPDGADGSFGLLLRQGVGVLATLVWSGGLSFLIFKGLSLVVSLRADEQDEWSGMDMAESGERAYITTDLESAAERSVAAHVAHG